MMMDSAIGFLNSLSRCIGSPLFFPPLVILQFAGLEQAQNPAGKDIRRPIQIRFRDIEFRQICVSKSRAIRPRRESSL
jgi:hypothetical protein